MPDRDGMPTVDDLLAELQEAHDVAVRIGDEEGVAAALAAMAQLRQVGEERDGKAFKN
jgi:hypothetical protein